MTPKVVVVGLGPGGADLVMPRAVAALRRAPVLVRTERHPAVQELREQGIEMLSLDEVYEAAADLDAAYAEIVRRVVEAAGVSGSVVYAVPGNPGVAERAVGMLRVLASAGEIELEIVPGLSFVDIAWARIGVDPMANGARVVDGRNFVVSAAGLSGALLIAQCDSKFVLSDVKLALLEVLPPESEVLVLQRLGLPSEAAFSLALEDLDRRVEPDHLTSIYVDTGEALVAGEFAKLFSIAEQLRAPGGCPWDAEQTHRSLSRYLLEEAYETVETIEGLSTEAPAGEADLDAYALLADELGDVLYQVVFHSILAEEAGAFTMADVSRGIQDKLIRRHPHVFGDVEANTSDEVLANWEMIKQEEKGTSSIIEGISASLPSVLYALKLFRKAETIGMLPEGRAGALAELDASVDAVRQGVSGADDPLIGDLLAAAVALSRADGADAEAALRAWAQRFRAHFLATEALAASEGVDLREAEPGVAHELWGRAG